VWLWAPWKEKLVPGNGATPSSKHDHRIAQVLIDGQKKGDGANDSPPGDSPKDALFAVERTVTRKGPEPVNFKVEEKNEFDVERPVKLAVTLVPEDETVKLPRDSLAAIWVNGEELNLRKDAPRVTADGIETPPLKTKLKPRENWIRVQVKPPAGVATRVQVSCKDDYGQVTLHVFAVGVSKYLYNKLAKDGKKEATLNDLDFADKDAEELARTLQDQAQRGEKGLFPKVATPTILLNEKATRDAILDGLAQLKERVSEHDLAVIIFSGHGQKHPDSGEYFFLPADFKTTKSLSRGISWQAMKRTLGYMPCRVVVILDTCHAGAAGLKGNAESELQQAVDKSLKEFTRARRGILILAACLGSQPAQENENWKHGALSLAILECIRGKQEVERRKGSKSLELLKNRSAAGLLTLGDVEQYAKIRVKELVKGGQGVVLSRLNDIAPEQIPIATYHRAP
jgi:hypothetical protein